MKHKNMSAGDEKFIKSLLKRYRIKAIDNQSCKLISRRTNMTWKIEILPPSTIKV